MEDVKGLWHILEVMSLPKVLTPNLTSYDLIKSFAVIIMVLDHVGHYFFPELTWIRAVGRVGFPIWFFLVGYSTGRDIPLKLIYGAAFLAFMNFVTGLAIFPLNALVTIIIIRLTLDWIMNPVMQGNRSIWLVSIILLILVIPTMNIAEYGTQAIITAIFGYLVCHRDRIMDEAVIVSYMIFALLSFIMYQQLFFGFTIADMVVVALGTLGVRYYLYKFEPREYPVLTAKLPRPAVASLQFMGRKTLEIYIAHLALFKVAALLLGDERFQWFRLIWLDTGP